MRVFRCRVVEAHWLHDNAVSWLLPATQYLLIELCGETQTLDGNVLQSVLIVSLLATEAQPLSDGTRGIDLVIVSDLLHPLPKTHVGPV